MAQVSRDGFDGLGQVHQAPRPGQEHLALGVVLGARGRHENLLQTPGEGLPNLREPQTSVLLGGFLLLRELGLPRDVVVQLAGGEVRAQGALVPLARRVLEEFGAPLQGLPGVPCPRQKPFLDHLVDLALPLQGGRDGVKDVVPALFARERGARDRRDQVLIVPKTSAFQVRGPCQRRRRRDGHERDPLRRLRFDWHRLYLPLHLLHHSLHDSRSLHHCCDVRKHRSLQAPSSASRLPVLFLMPGWHCHPELCPPELRLG